MRNYIILTTLIACISMLTACGSKSEESATTPIVYRMKTIEIPDSIIASDVVITDDAVYYLDSTGVIRIDYEGNIETVFSLPATESFACLFIDEVGNFNVLAYSKGEDGKTSLTVRRFSPSGGNLPRTNLGPFAESEDFSYPVNFLINDGHFYVQSMSGVYVYDMGGNLIYEALGDGDTFSRSLFVLEDGRVGSASARFENNNDSFIARIYNIEEKDFDEYRVNVTGSTQDAIIKNGGATGLLLGDSNGLFEFALGNRSSGALEHNRNNLLSFLERGVNAGDIKDIHKTLEGNIIIILKRGIILAGDILVFSEHGEAGTLTAEGGWTPEVETGPTETGIHKVKEVVTLAIPEFGFSETWLQLYITDFNRTNPDYTIEVVSYMDNFSNDEYEDALKRFNIDIGTGKLADITAFPRFGVSIYSYTSKGIFVDLYELMENDPDTNKNDYLPGVFEALEMDGKLYTIFPIFWLSTIVAKTSEVGGTPGLSIDEFIDYLDSKPEAEDIIMDMDRHKFILMTSLNYFTDRGTGRMTFDRDIFMKILKAAQRFPIDRIEYSDDGTGLFPHLGAKQGEPLMIDGLVFGVGNAFRNIKQFEYFFGEEVTYIGLPTPDGSGSFFWPFNRFAIAEQSEKKEGAWQFIKHMMNNYNMDWKNAINLPIKMSEFERMAHEATIEFEDNPYWRDIMIGTAANGDPITVRLDRDNTLEENQKLWDLLLKTNAVEPSEPVILGIINQEIRDYLTGQKPAEVVIDIIENRVNLYLSEIE